MICISFTAVPQAAAIVYLPVLAVLYENVELPAVPDAVPFTFHVGYPAGQFLPGSGVAVIVIVSVAFPTGIYSVCI